MNDVKTKETAKELYEKFNKIRNMGYVKGLASRSKGSPGLTFEKLLGKENDEFQIADYKGIEIKVKNEIRYSYRYLTLFSLVPSNCFGILLKQLRNNYGSPDKDFKNINTLMKSVFANIKTKTQNGYLFKLQIKRTEKRIYLCIYDKNENLINKDLYWEFDDIKSVVERKLTYLALVKYNKKLINRCKFFKYNSIKFYKFKGINCFFNLLEKGLIRIYICLGVYKSGYKIGLEHDHGMRFDIKECDLLKLYDDYLFLDGDMSNCNKNFHKFIK